MKTMKSTIWTLAFLLFASFSAMAMPNRGIESAFTVEGALFLEDQLGIEDFKDLTIKDFLSLTPKKIEDATGRKLNWKEGIALKQIQKKIKKGMKKENAPDEDDKILIYVLAFLLPPLAVFLCYEMEDNKFLINLILSILCWLPGVIHALVVCSKYFNGKS